jgi:predicted outer membrane repeat protein
MNNALRAALTLLMLAVLSLRIGTANAATLTVTNTNDSGTGSLRQALADASNGDTVTFDPSVTGTISLTSSPLVISTNLTITGPGPAQLAISGNDARAVCVVIGGVSVSISGLALTHGYDNSSGGAAISTGGALTLDNCVLSNNVSANTDDGQGGAILCYDQGLPVVISNCVFLNNSAPRAGGAICTEIFGGPVRAVSITRCSFSGNSCAQPSGQGGAIGAYGANVTIADSTFQDNNAPVGGAVFSSSSVTATGSTFANNRAVANTTANVSGDGGAIYGGTVNLTNCTITGNTAEGTTYGGGGIFATSAAITNCSVANNSAPNANGGGIDTVSGSLTATNSILAGNTAVSGPDCSGSLISNDYNLIQNTSGCTITGATTHNITGVDPLLGPLQNNGGPTMTRALLAGSPAIDAGDPATPLTTDQRGLPRPKDGNGDGVAVSDIGAFEVQTTYSVSGRVSDGSGAGISGATLTLGGATAQSNSAGYFTFAAVPAGSYTLTPSYNGYMFQPAYRSVRVVNSNITGQNFVGGYQIAGRISDNTGKALVNVPVTRSGSDTPAYTNSAGYYTFSFLLPGTYTVTPHLNGYSFTPASRTVNLTNGSVSSQNFTAAFAYTVSGRISTSSGAAIAGVTVSLSPAPDGVVSPAFTNSAGYFTFLNVPAGSYTLTPAKFGATFLPASRSITVTTAALSGQNFTGDAGHTVSGSIALSNGVPLAGANVVASPGQSSTPPTNSRTSPVVATIFITTDTYNTYAPNGVPRAGTGNRATLTLIDTRYQSFSSGDFVASDLRSTSVSAFSAAHMEAQLDGAELIPVAIGQSALSLSDALLSSDFARDGLASRFQTAAGAPWYDISPNPPSAAQAYIGQHYQSVVDGSEPVNGAAPFIDNPRVMDLIVTNPAPITPGHLTMPVLDFAPVYVESARLINGIAQITVRFLPKYLDPGAYGVFSATTDSVGNFRFSQLPNGMYTLTPMLSGYSFTPPAKTITVAGATVTGQDFIGSQP